MLSFRGAGRVFESAKKLVSCRLSAVSNRVKDGVHLLGLIAAQLCGCSGLSITALQSAV